MEKEILEWLEKMNPEVKKIKWVEQAAATLQFWRESGFCPPEGLTSQMFLTYCFEKASEKAKSLRPFRVEVGRYCVTTITVEAHNAREAQDIVYEYADANQELVWEEMVDGLKTASRWEYSDAYECLRDEEVDVPYNVAVDCCYIPCNDEN